METIIREIIGRSRFNRLRLFWLIAVIALIAPWLRSADTGAAERCRVNSVYDGDTLRATCDAEQVKLRFYCIDTPEIKQAPWGRQSRDYLRSITPETVSIIRHDKDRYGRIVAEVMDGQTNLNLAMVLAGQAAVYPRYCHNQAYYTAQQQAQSAQRGIWSQPGLQQTPWQWRHKR